MVDALSRVTWQSATSSLSMLDHRRRRHYHPPQTPYMPHSNCVTLRLIFFPPTASSWSQISIVFFFHFFIRLSRSQHAAASQIEFFCFVLLRHRIVRPGRERTSATTRQLQSNAMEGMVCKRRGTQKKKKKKKRDKRRN